MYMYVFVQSYLCFIYGIKLDLNIRLSASNGNQCDCVISAACLPGGTDPTMLACCRSVNHLLCVVVVSLSYIFVALFIVLHYNCLPISAVALVV